VGLATDKGVRFSPAIEPVIPGGHQGTFIGLQLEGSPPNGIGESGEIVEYSDEVVKSANDLLWREPGVLVRGHKPDGHAGENCAIDGIGWSDARMNSNPPAIRIRRRNRDVAVEVEVAANINGVMFATVCHRFLCGTLPLALRLQVRRRDRNVDRGGNAYR